MPHGNKRRGLTSVQAFLERRELTSWCCVVWCRWTCLIVTMTAAYLLLCCVAVVLPLMAVSGENVQLMEWQRMQDAWSQWKKQHGKVYSNYREEVYRHHVFYQNLGKISAHNAQYPLSVSYTRGLNQFSDMTVEEYRMYNQLQPRSHLSSVCHDTHRAVTNSPLPATVDWRTKGYVTAVKNQGQCGSCWAFSTTGSVEGQHFKQTGHLLSLSEQQLVDCSQAEGNDGCNGGLMDNGFKYIMSQPGGLETEQEYPYQAMDGNCSAVPSEEKAKISGCVDVTSEDEGALQHATALVGPISVAIDASHDSFQSYSGGVYYEPQCSSTQLDHGVLVVGYGTYQGQDYWLVKNSWGADWGMNGYIMMARNRNNMCGIASMASYPTV